MSDLKTAYDVLRQKKRHYDRLWAYYDGNQPLIYSSERLREVFSSLNASFTQNWCSVVVDSVLERMEFKQFHVANNDTLTRQLNQWWQLSGMELDADDVELCALVTGEAYVMVWPVDGGGMDAYYNDSRLAHVWYDDENPRRMSWAAKWWQTADGHVRLNLYYPQRLEYYISSKPMKEISSHTSFQPYLQDETDDQSWMAENPLQMIPFFHFRRERRAIKSELGPSILDLQNAVNKLISDMMVASEFNAFPQRWIISQSDVGQLKNAPNEIWDLPAGDGISQGTAVGQLSPGSSDNYLRGIEQLSTAIAKISRTPQYYFFLGARADPSGETLMAMDAPLVAKVKAYIKRFRREWARLALFVAGGDVDLTAIQAIYAEPGTMQPKTQAETRKTNVEAGIPLATQLREEGWSPRQLDQMAADKQAEQDAATENMAVALLNQERQFSQPPEVNGAG